MRKIVNSTYISLDGVIENPQNWTMDYFGEEAQGFAREQLFASDALLMGRATYDGFSQAWPAMEEQTGDFGARMNNLPHYVVSDSLEKGEWNNTVIIRRADAVAEIAKLKEQDGQDILQYGFGPSPARSWTTACWTSCACGSTRSSSAPATPPSC
ncbi:dihydrofolate reductase family protein [Actinomadura sp. J1-007]|uniref:dihydrofolate reductase family protein n=1 Tax=Actinomadura sp. J1-007 TaxID=2661913 RepID=UPI0019D4FD7F|nr:dihydrofolate reductase family protein [Actinomadura sp. J1-007]